MLADVDGDLFALLLMSIHQYPLNEVIAVLISSNVDEWNARTIRMSRSYDRQISVEKLNAPNLETFLDNLGGILVDAVAVGVDEDVIDDSSFVRRGTVLAKMLDAPIAELSMGNEIDVGDDLLNGWSLLIFDAVLKDVLDHEASSLTQCNLMPHATKSVVDLDHNLWWFATPTKLEKLLPDMAGISMDNSIRDSAKKFSDHIGFVTFGNRIESLLNDMAAEGIHAE